jgi:hypothetical protein
MASSSHTELDALVTVQASRAAWLAWMGMLLQHRGQADLETLTAHAEAAMAKWPDGERRISEDTYLQELVRGDDARPYWFLGRALSLDLELLASPRFSARGLQVVAGLEILQVERGLKPRVRHVAATVRTALKRMPRLKELVLDDSRMGATMARCVLAEARPLERLRLRRCDLSPGTLAKLLETTAAEALVELDAAENSLSGADLASVARSAAARSLTRLDLSGNDLWCGDCPSMRGCLPRLKSLSLAASGLRAHALCVALRHWQLPSLRSVDLSQSPQDADDLRELLAWLPDGVVELVLVGTALDDAAIDVLADCGAARASIRVDLRGNELAILHRDRLRRVMPLVLVGDIV